MDHKVFVFKKISRLSRPTEPSGALESQILVGFQGQECVKSTLGGGDRHNSGAKTENCFEVLELKQNPQKIWQNYYRCTSSRLNHWACSILPVLISRGSDGSWEGAYASYVLTL